MIPNNLEECYDILDSEFKTVFSIISLGELWAFHHTLGRYIRNNWGLWRDEDFRKRYNVEKSPIRELLVEMGFTHADDMSTVILESYWHKLHGKEYDFIRMSEGYRKFWNNQG